jgi:uncharacterized protein (UPF0332 family)
MRPGVDALLRKAERSFEAAEALRDRGDGEFAAPRVYYACFYIAEALLLQDGHEFGRHGQVIAQYGRLFARTGVLDPAFHRLLLDAFHLRQLADYVASPEIPSGKVDQLIGEGRRFLTAARSWLAAASD